MDTLSKGTLFDAEIVSDVINGVKGKSSLIKLSKQKPIPFNGQKEFIFTMDSEIDIVAEGGKMTAGGISLEPVTTVPIKVEYGARVTDEFMHGADEFQIEILGGFIEGFASKLAKGIDLMAMHGVNPRTGTASEIIGNNNFDSKATQTIVYDSTNPDSNINAAIGLIQATDKEVSGVIMSREFSTAMANMRTRDDNNVEKFPELAWGATPATLNNMPIDINNTVANGTDDLAIIGDFGNMFKWGYAKEMSLEVIEYGDPDNSGRDLAGHGQVYLRAVAYVGWAIMDGDSFSRVIKEPVASPETIQATSLDVTSEPVETESESVSDDVDIDALTIEQIKQELDAFGVTYDANADKQTLYDLMMSV
ncbi:phage major capsid protein [Lactococcus sp. dk322]|nr:phage major capsid protein [Lactococcus sp. dk101]TXK38070.1 phage major capsid protein [Lactococcus sp. dk310]TXK49749.1 phage major capsid protein [Lactococcus sp. dk322]